VKRTVQHVDFLVVNMNEAITVDVHLEIVGESDDVKNNAGMIDPQLTALTVEAKPGNIPTSIVVDISNLNVGEAVRIGDLVLPEGVTTLLDPDTVVVSAVATRAAVAAAESGEGEAPAAE
jgi:large subunit ribosomal protein L25